SRCNAAPSTAPTCDPVRDDTTRRGGGVRPSWVGVHRRAHTRAGNDNVRRKVVGSARALKERWARLLGEVDRYERRTEPGGSRGRRGGVHHERSSKELGAVDG